VNLDFLSGVSVRALHYLTISIGLVGVAVIAWGVVISLLDFIRLEASHWHGGTICREREVTRQHLASYILVGLEFLVAADVVRTLVKPSLKEIAVLASIVAIRTVLSFFLDRELSEHACTPAETVSDE
jgi:uncharacterized membrane protein